MENFTKYIRQNKKAAYAIAKANCSHDSKGTCLFSKDDLWMQENCWDEDSLEAIDSAHDYTYIVLKKTKPKYNQFGLF